MLNAAKAKLAALQGLDQTSLTSHIGAIAGSTLQQSAFSAQISGPPIAGSALTANGPTSTVATTTGATPSTTTTTAAPNQSLVTTNPQLTSSVPSPATGTSFTLPSTFGTSASDVLNEQMQLTYEIANLELLLEGSLSDRFVQGTRIIKRRTTIGFPVSLVPKYKDAVAVIDVTAASPMADTFTNEPPSITALLPKDKTYNVAAVTDHSTSIGAGIVTHILSGGASWMGGRKTFYIVQDQDTVALAKPSSGANTTSFAWQFRPVLGQHYIRTGMRQTFVQLAVPVSNFAGCFGKVHLITYWRKFDRDHGIVGEIIPQSLREQDVDWSIPVYDLAPKVDTLAYEDVGNGFIQVRMGGKFLSGTYVRVGNSYFRDGVAGFTSETNQIRFVAPAVDIALHRPMVVSRDGTEVEILNPADAEPRPSLNASCGPAATNNCGQKPQETKAARTVQKGQASVAMKSLDDSNVLLEVTATNVPNTDDDPKRELYYLLIGNRLFGLTDSTFERSLIGTDSITYKLAVPLPLISSAREIQLLPLFWNRDKYLLRRGIENLALPSNTEKLVLIAKADDKSRFVLLGNRLSGAKVVEPAGVALVSFDGLQNDDTIRIIELTSGQLKTTKQIVIQKGAGERPILVSIPAADAAGTAKPSLVAPRITVGADEVSLSGDGVDKVRVATFKKKPLKVMVADDKKSVVISGLATAGVTVAASEQEIECQLESGQKTTVKIDVVSSKVETVDRTKN